MVPMDVNKDGNMDVIVAGNLFVSEVETGRADAGTGLILLGDGKGGFEDMALHDAGFLAHFDVKDLALIESGNGKSRILVANNDRKMQVFEFRGQADKPQFAER